MEGNLHNFLIGSNFMKKEIKKGKIVVSKDGPYLISGNLPLEKEIITTDKEGEVCCWKKGNGHSATARHLHFRR